jgi:hypothetical protein
MTRDQALTLPAGVADRLAGESEAARLVRLREQVRCADFDRRALRDDQRRLLELGEDDAPDLESACGLRLSQLEMVRACMEKTGAHRSRLNPEEFSAARALGAAASLGPAVAGWLAGLPDVAEFTGRFPPRWRMRGRQPVAAFPAEGHDGLWDQAGPAEALDDAERVIRGAIERGMAHAATILWAGVHPSATALEPLARALVDRLARYKDGPPTRTFRTLPRPKASAEAIGIALDLYSQATGIELPNPTGAKVLFVKSNRLGWAKPRTKT